MSNPITKSRSTLTLVAQHEISQPPSDAISAVHFSPSSHKLLVASWDKNVYLYSAQPNGESKLLQTYPHRAPVLDVCWGDTDEEAFSVGLDWDVRRLDLSSQEQTVLSSHTAGASRVVYSHKYKLLVSASWDKTLHIHNRADAAQGVHTVFLPAKPFALALSPSKMVLAMSGRQTSIYDLQSVQLLVEQSAGGGTVGASNENAPGALKMEPWQRRESSLKYMTRAAACMPDDRGYATSSIEGRVAVEWFADDEATQAKKYAFKCHRQAAPASEGEGIDVVYPVNALAFHPEYGTFASGGGDGVASVWDAAAKKRIKNYAKLGASVAALDWSHDGNFLAIGISPGFEDGKEDAGDESGNVKILLREIAEGEAKAKPKGEK